MKFAPRVHMHLLGWTALLMVAGLVVLRSASHHMGWQLVGRQALWLALGIVVCLLLRRASYRWWLDASWVGYVGGVILLLLLLVVGRVSHGATRWMSLGPLSFQPSEFMKIITVLFLARLLGDHMASGKPLTHQCAFMVMGCGALPALLTFLQPDLGTASTFLWVLLVMLWVAGISGRVIGGLCGMGVLVLPLGVQLLQAYQRTRLLVFLNPNLDPLGAGYTVIQSRIAIGSGGLVGKGWMSGTQSQLHFLPERHTDFIFSVVGEEWGLVGCVVLLGLFSAWLMSAWGVAYRVQEPRARLMVAGLAALVAYHVVINVGMTMGLLPVVGIPLPLVSYGGSAAMMVLIAVGIIESVRRWSPRF